MINIAVAQSGGPTCAINSSLAGVFSEAFKSDEIGIVYGFKNGVEGIIHDNIVNLNERLSEPHNIELLKLTPSTALGSCRVKLPDMEDSTEPYEIIINTFNKYNIKAFFYIGGNDSMDTVAKLSKYLSSIQSDIKVMGIPKTIDNDLVGTDHTPGFGSAAKYIATTVQEIIRDSQVYSLNSVTIIEIMGRDAGWLTASASVLRANGETAPHLIYLPEISFSPEQFLEDIKAAQKEHKAVIVAVSEGIRLSNGNYVASGHLSGTVDVFGHQYLSGLGKYLENYVKQELKCKVRSIELNVMQRCSSHLASLTDINEAHDIGAAAVKEMLKGTTGKMMCYVRDNSRDYSIKMETVNISEVANKEKFFPKEWVNEKGNNIKDEAINYFLPLIQGEVTTVMNKGMPVHFKF